MDPETDFTLNGVQPSKVSHLKLLGISLQDDLKWNLHVDEIVSKASRRLYTLCILRNSRTPVEDMITVYTCCIRPVLEYACPVWHTSLTESLIYKIEFVQKRALRIILGKKYTSYSEALDLCKLPSLQCRREVLLQSFGMKIIKSNKHRELLPPTKVSTSCRQLRYMSGLRIIKCNTERYHRSTIIIYPTWPEP